MVAQSIRDADTFFGIELPALADGTFGAEQGAAINRPVLSVVGAETQPLWVEIADFLRASLPYTESREIVFRRSSGRFRFAIGRRNLTRFVQILIGRRLR